MNLKETLKRLEPFWHKEPPADGFQAIDEIEAAMKLPLPADYKYFLQWFSNGGEGSLPGGYLALYPAEEVLVRQSDYEISDKVPGLLIFGSEGDDVFCFDTSLRRSTADYPVLRISLSSLDPEEKEVVGRSFAEFLQHRIKGA